MPNSSPITITQLNEKTGWYADAPYDSNSAYSIDVSAADIAVLMSLASNATLGIDLGAVQTSGGRTLDFIIESIDNTSGQTNSGTKYFSGSGEITAQQATTRISEYQNHRDQYTPSTTDGFGVETGNVTSMQALSGYSGIRFIALRESEDGPLNVAMRPVDANGDTIGTSCYNLARPKPFPPK